MTDKYRTRRLVGILCSIILMPTFILMIFILSAKERLLDEELDLLKRAEQWYSSASDKMKTAMYAVSTAHELEGWSVASRGISSRFRGISNVPWGIRLESYSELQVPQFKPLPADVQTDQFRYGLMLARSIHLYATSTIEQGQGERRMNIWKDKLSDIFPESYELHVTYPNKYEESAPLETTWSLSAKPGPEYMWRAP
ncbi:MAG TPA: hypothetical protein VIR63_00940 [Pontiella sp.]